MDLIHEYFQRDLTEDESKQLQKLLASSPEEAERFAGAMGGHYNTLGLPNPVWDVKPFNPPHGLGWKLFLKTLRLTDLGGFAKLSLVAASLTAVTVVSYKTYEAKQAPAPIAAVSTPAPTPLPPRYQQLSVNVELPKAGLVTVKVFDDDNELVKTLYAGVLPAGKKDFLWDGKKEDGAVASPGTYFIKVQSGRNEMKREVHLKGD